MTSVNKAIRSTGRRILAVLGAAIVVAVGLLVPASAQAEFGFRDGSVFAKTHDTVPGKPTFPGELFDGAMAWSNLIRSNPEQPQAGGHFDATAGFAGNPLGLPDDPYHPDGQPKDIEVQTPPGFIGNPQVVSTCDYDAFYNYGGGSVTRCPKEAQLGMLVATVTATQEPGAGERHMMWGQASPLYRLDDLHGYPAVLGFRDGAGSAYTLVPSLDPARNYALNVRAPTIQRSYGLTSAATTVFGVPYASVHDSHRYDDANPSSDPSIGLQKRALLSNPTYCGDEPLETVVRMRSWQDPSHWVEQPVLTETPTVGCEQLQFGTPGSPVSLLVQPSSTAPDSPAGVAAKLRLPFNDNPAGLASPALRDTVVELPEGLTVNPAAGDGLAGCTPAQIGLKTDRPVACPDGSKLGTVRVKTPLLGEELSGVVYQAMPFDNPFNSLVALYLVVENEARGILVKIPGEAELDPQTGKITTTFRDNPQLPFTELDLDLKTGPRAPLATPQLCGTHETVSTLTPWSYPQSGPAAVRQDPFEIKAGGGLDCPASLAARPNEPEFEAGTLDPTGGEHSTFKLTVAREDGEQEIKSIKSVRLPDGLLGDVSSVPLCGDAAADAGTCPEASRVGRVQVSAGAGSSPLWVPQPGKAATGVYLTGPYRGGAYGLSIKVPAQAGPFDLGTVVVRSALHVDERTAAITSGVDETRLIGRDGSITEIMPEALPRILDGIVLRQREIRLLMDRKDFMINPTDCSEKQITAEIHSFDGGRADVGNRFQAGDCAALGFKPRFRAKILDKGRKSTRRSWHPRTRFTVVPRKGDANIGGARVALPSSTILDQGNIGTTCTRAQMAARDCPAKSIVGYAKAWSPILKRTVQGPVYLAANGGVRPLPDIAAVLDGEVRVMLVGEVTTLRTGGKARLQNTFRVVPDAPVTRFELTMQGGKNTGLLVNSTDLCRSSERGVAVFQGQNGRQSRQNLRIATSFKGCGKVRRQAARKAAKRKAARKAAARRASRG